MTLVRRDFRKMAEALIDWADYLLIAIMSTANLNVDIREELAVDLKE